MKKVFSGVLVLSLLLAIQAMAQSKGTAKQPAKTSPIRPSLDVLVSRIDAYWKSLSDQKKMQAADYIDPSDREAFYSSSIPPFSKPQLKSLELSADRREATTTVVVTRMMPPLTTKMEWTVTERWHFERGNWYRAFPKSSHNPVLESIKALTPDRAQTEKWENEIRKTLTVESVLDFGTVRESAHLQLALKYTLSGKDNFSAKLKLPPGFTAECGEECALIPGEHELRVNVPTWQLEGTVHERITLSARRDRAVVPFEIEVKGFIYVPVSITSKVISLSPNQAENELRVKNNTKSAIELLEAYSEAMQVTVDSLPATIPPGGEIALKVKLDTGLAPLVAGKFYSLTIPLAKPVENVNFISFGVVGGSVKETAIGTKSNQEIVIQSDKSKSCKNPPPD
jgi:hypothetical protein